MSCLSWNYQGLGNPSTVHVLNRTIKQKRPNLVFLMETKLLKSELVFIQNKLGFNSIHVVDVDTSHGGRRGRLCLLWNNSLDVSILSTLAHHIDACIKQVNDVGEWRFCGIYGWSEEIDKPLTWQLIQTLATSSNLLWCCVGDFNEILYLYEKRGGNLRDHAKMLAFRTTLENHNLEGLGFIGCRFTWTNNQSGDRNI